MRVELKDRERVRPLPCDRPHLAIVHELPPLLQKLRVPPKQVSSKLRVEEQLEHRWLKTV